MILTGMSLAEAALAALTLLVAGLVVYRLLFTPRGHCSGCCSEGCKVRQTCSPPSSQQERLP